MNEFNRIGLRQLLEINETKPEIISSEKLQDMISGFSCPQNKDVEKFLQYKAIEFEKQGTAATHLVLAMQNQKLILAGYFTLASKYIHIDFNNKKYPLRYKLRKRINRFGTRTPNELNIRGQIIAMPLIGQLGKNYAQEKNTIITGNELVNVPPPIEVGASRFFENCHFARGVSGLMLSPRA